MSSFDELNKSHIYPICWNITDIPEIEKLIDSFEDLCVKSTNNNQFIKSRILSVNINYLKSKIKEINRKIKVDGFLPSTMKNLKL